MFRTSVLALSALALLATTTATTSAAGLRKANAPGHNSQPQVAKPKFEDLKLQTGMALSGPSTRTVRGGGFFQIRDAGG
jgi:hypothetical protein